jgi:hypothetical protein
MSSLSGTTENNFYTRPIIADHCVFLLGHIDLNEYDEIIEPSAGPGSFTAALTKAANHDVTSIEINTEFLATHHCDFLNYNLPIGFKILVAGNPPFSLAMAFIEKCFAHKVQTIGFILPFGMDGLKGFQDKCRLNDYKITHSYPLPTDSFIFNGEISRVATSFVIIDQITPMLSI